MRIIMRLLLKSTGSILRHINLGNPVVALSNQTDLAIVRPEKRMGFYLRELETLERNRLRQLQDERLGCLLQELAQNRFYQDKFHRAGIEMQQLHSAEDLQRLPFTTKSELV